MFIVLQDVFKLKYCAFDRLNLHSSKHVRSLNRCQTKGKKVSQKV